MDQPASCLLLQLKRFLLIGPLRLGVVMRSGSLGWWTRVRQMASHGTARGLCRGMR